MHAALLFLLLQHCPSFPTFWPGCLLTACADPPPPLFNIYDLRLRAPSALRRCRVGRQASRAGPGAAAQRSALPSPLRSSVTHSACGLPPAPPLQHLWTHGCVNPLPAHPLLCGAAEWAGRPAAPALARRLSPASPVPLECHTQRVRAPPHRLFNILGPTAA